jgi:hypothetical protein
MNRTQQPGSFGGAMPRVVPYKMKYKDPYGMIGGINDMQKQDYIPQNIAYDKRVFRGSTNAAMVIPSGTYPD